MPSLLLHILIAFCLDVAYTLRRRERDMALEVLLLRQQLRLYERRAKRPRASRLEKVVLGSLAARLPDLARVTLVFTPATLLRWHRETVRRKWTFANAPKPGRPRTSTACVELVLLSWLLLHPRAFRMEKEPRQRQRFVIETAM